MPNGKGFRNHPDSKTQPGECGGYSGNYNGDTHDFNTKGKITNTKGSEYHDVSRKDSGFGSNFAEKDAQAAYLRDRGMKGQVVKNFSGTEEQSREHTNNIGPTAYNNRPINEVYKPATSQNVPSAQPIVRPVAKKSEGK